MGLVLLSCSNVFNSSDSEYEIKYIRLETSLDFQIADLVDNGHFLDKIHIPFSEETMGFLLIESPELVDSVCPGITYSGSETPHLEDMFPEGGMLLVYNGCLLFGETLEDYTLTHQNSSVYIDEVVYRWNGPYDPGLWESVFVIGVIPL